ncbi:hypothetical protein [Furfurilactobacillus rossiae]|nr:hypothetical protein [Furfurilactobacillus rossiae]
MQAQFACGQAALGYAQGIERQVHVWKSDAQLWLNSSNKKRVE